MSGTPRDRPRGAPVAARHDGARTVGRAHRCQLDHPLADPPPGPLLKSGTLTAVKASCPRVWDQRADQVGGEQVPGTDLGISRIVVDGIGNITWSDITTLPDCTLSGAPCTACHDRAYRRDRHHHETRSMRADSAICAMVGISRDRAAARQRAQGGGPAGRVHTRGRAAPESARSPSSEVRRIRCITQTMVTLVAVSPLRRASIDKAASSMRASAAAERLR
jgi:hypothetical protein